jgi:hypothetical protein
MPGTRRVDPAHPIAVSPVTEDRSKDLSVPRELSDSGMKASMGIAEVSPSLGFREIVRRSPERPVLRLEL